MAVVPEYMRRQGLDSGPTGPMASPEAFGAGVGRGLQQAGNAISDLAGVMQQDYQERAYFDAATKLQDLQTGADALITEADRTARPDAGGYAKAVTDGFDAQAKAYLDGLDPRTRRRFEPQVANLRGAITTNATRRELTLKDDWYRGQIVERVPQFETEAVKAPGDLDAVVGRFGEFVDTTGLPAAEREEMKRRGRLALTQAAARGEIERDPAAAAAMFGSRSVSVNGRAIPADAAPLEVAKQFLGKSEGADAAALSAFFEKSAGLKLDPRSTAWCAAFVNGVLGASGRGGTGRLNARSFLDYGTPTDQPGEGDIVVLQRGGRNHWSGHVGIVAGFSEDGKKVRVVGGNQSNKVSVAEFPVEQVLGYRRPPAAGSAAPVSSEKGAFVVERSIGDPDPRFANLPLPVRLGLADDADRAWTAQRSSVAAAQKADVEAARNDLYVGLHDGRYGVAEIQAAREGGLLTDYAHIDKAETVLAERQKKETERAEGERLVTGDETPDPLSSDHRKAVNGYWNADGAAPQRLAAGDPEEAGRLATVVGKTGIIPKDAAGVVSGMLRSDDPKKLTAAVAIIDQVTAANPEAASRGTGQGGLNEGDRRVYQAVRDLAPYLTPEELKVRIRRMRDPADRPFQEASDKAAATELKDVADATIVQYFDASWWSDPRISPDAVPGLRADFDALYREFRRAYDTPEAAQEAALRVLGTRWGVSQVAGGQVLMRNPPEKVLPAIDGTHDWLAKQLEATVKSQMGEDAPSDLSAVFLKATRDTDVDVEAGRSPAYAIVVQRADGMFESPGRVRFDVEAARGGAGKAREQKREDFTKERTEQQDDRRTLEELNRDSSGGAIVPRDELFGDR